MLPSIGPHVEDLAGAQSGLAKGRALRNLNRMPELPEVEIVRRGLAPAMEGASFATVTLNRGDLRFPFEKGFARGSRAQRVRAADAPGEIHHRRNGERACACHAPRHDRALHHPAGGAGGGETPGAFYYSGDADPRHDHVIFAMSSGDTIRYNDVRRFGYMTLFEVAAMTRIRCSRTWRRAVGGRPRAAYLVERAQGKSQQLKGFLLDQRIIAGLGNIYVCEALFRASLPPQAEAGDLARGKRGAAAAKRLAASIKGVLGDASGRRLLNPRLPRCRRRCAAASRKSLTFTAAPASLAMSCGPPIERIVQQGRSTFFCPRCQSSI